MLNNLISVSSQVGILFILIATGFICAKKKVFTDESIKSLTGFILYVVTPCVIIASFHREFDSSMLHKLIQCALLAFGIHFINIIIAHSVIRSKDFDKKIVLQYGTVFSNCGYMALPLQNAILGSEGVFLGATFICVFNLLTWTYGLVLMSGETKNLSAKKIILNPGILGVLIGLIFFVSPVKLPPVLLSPVNHLAALNTPLPMIVIGFYLSKISSPEILKNFSFCIAILFRLIICPLIALFILKLLNVNPFVSTVVIISASAPGAANTTMFAAMFNRDTKVAGAFVALSTLFSIITMPLIISMTL